MKWNEISNIKSNFYSAIISEVKKNSTRIEDDEKIILHASSMDKVCPRLIYYLIKDKISLKRAEQVLNRGLGVTYGIGIAVEDFVIKSLDHYTPVETLFRYVCPVCKYSEIQTNKVSHICPTCNVGMKRQQITIEHKITDRVAIKGNMDLLLRLKSDEHFKVYELKTIDKDLFAELESPMIHHLYQISTYLWLIKHLPKSDREAFNLDFNRGYVVYICKGHKQDPLKIYEVKYNRNKFIREIDDLIKQIKQIPEIIPDKICNSKYSTLAKECPLKSTCFPTKGDL